MNENIFSTSDLIKQIREYQNKHTELLESHHFVFDCPLGLNKTIKPEIIWMGINPGNDVKARSITDKKNDEETRDRNFQLEYRRASGSIRMMNTLKNCLGLSNFNKTSLTEMFFWCSKDMSKAFEKRFGYKFLNNKHMDFCLKINKEFFSRANPKFIIGPHYLASSKKRVDIIKQYFDLKFLKEYRNKKNQVFLEHYIMDNKYNYLNCKFPGQGNWYVGEMYEMYDKIQSIINENNYIN